MEIANGCGVERKGAAALEREKSTKLHPPGFVVEIWQRCCGGLRRAEPMSIFAALRMKWNYSVESPGMGRLVYREGNREYTFPIYQEDDVLVLVGVPSAQRIHFFFNWYWHPRDFSPATEARILPRITEHLRSNGARVRVLSRDRVGEFAFHPELLEHRAQALELLEAAGYCWFSDFSSIDLLHEEYGLEVSGIGDAEHVDVILGALRRAFPHWHHTRVFPCDQEGWTVGICMYPSESCASGWAEGADY